MYVLHSLAAHLTLEYPTRSRTKHGIISISQTRGRAIHACMQDDILEEAQIADVRDVETVDR